MPVHLPEGELLSSEPGTLPGHQRSPRCGFPGRACASSATCDGPCPSVSQPIPPESRLAGERRAAVWVWRDVDGTCGSGGMRVGRVVLSRLEISPGKSTPRVTRSTPRVARHWCKHQQLTAAQVPSLQWLFLHLFPPLPKNQTLPTH